MQLVLFQGSPQLMSCIVWKTREQTYILYLELVSVFSHTDFSPLNMLSDEQKSFGCFFLFKLHSDFFENTQNCFAYI